MSNRVVHFEIHASDPQALITFYSELFGWTFQSWGPPGMYWLIETGAEASRGINGGLTQRRGAPAPAGSAVNAFVCTIDVESAEDSYRKALSLGATEALPVMAVPGVGWLAYANDPDGNIFGMMQNDPTAQ